MRTTRALCRVGDALVKGGVSSTNASLVATQTGQLSKTAPVTPTATPWKKPDDALMEGYGSSSEYSVSYSYPSRTSNAPRILDATHYKKVVPFQKSVWSPNADDVEEDTDGIMERPQDELMVHFARDEVVPVDTAVIAADDMVKQRRPKNSRRGALWTMMKRMGKKQSYTEEGLLVRDETFWQWQVEDKYGFMGKPKHLTWEQFHEELGGFSFFIELHPKKPEDYYILHLIQKDKDGSEVTWSAEHAAWQGPLLVDLYAAVGTMLTRRLKTRTLSCDNGRGTIKEFNIRHVSPYTSAVEINARPAYFYDPDLREMREENANWYFTKELIAHPGIDEEGTIHFYTSAEAVAYHLTEAVNALLQRPMWMFFRRGIRRTAEHLTKEVVGEGNVGHTLRSWAGFEYYEDEVWPAQSQIDAVTDHWLEDSPFPLTTVHKRLCRLARMRKQHLEARQWKDHNKTLTKGSGRALVETYAPHLLLPGGSPFLQDLLLEAPNVPERKTPYKALTDATVEKLKLLRAADEVKEAEMEREREEKERKRAKEIEAINAREAKEAQEQEAAARAAATAASLGRSKTVEELGRERQKQRAAAGDNAEDSEQWEWWHSKHDGDSSDTPVKERREPAKPASSLGGVEL